MLADRNNLNYFRVTGSGKYTIYMYPRKARRPEDIVVLNALNKVSCTKTKKGYGTKDSQDHDPGGELGLDRRPGWTSRSRLWTAAQQRAAESRS